MTAPASSSAAALPLSGVRVVDAGGPLGAYASKLFTDFGADVVHVESAAGDEMRRWPPLRKGTSLMFEHYHGGQRSVTVDVSAERSLGTLADLGRWADVVLLTPTPDRPVVGLDARERALSWAPDSAVVLCLTPFGLEGPLAGWRMTPTTSFAMSGLMLKMGPPAGPPVTVPGRHAWDQAGLQGVIAVLAALHARDSIGGQLIDVAVHDYLSSQDDFVQRYSVAQVILSRDAAASYPPTGTWECADGRIEFQVHTERHWAGFVDMLGNPDELMDPALAQRLVRARETDRLTAYVADALCTRSRYQLVEMGQARGVPCGLLNTPAQFVDDEQAVARGLFPIHDVPGLGPVRTAGVPFRSSATLVRDPAPAPAIGDGNHELGIEERTTA